MALLLNKKHIINSLGEEQELNIYTTKAEAVDTGKPCKVIQVEVDGEMITGYIGCTDELDTPKASSKRVLVDGVEYAERKYMGIKDMNNYMANAYPDTYKTLTEITEDMLPDTSDATNFSRAFMSCTEAKEIAQIDTRKATDVSYMYEWCYSCLVFPQIDTSKCKNFTRMYRICGKAISVSNIDFSQAIDEMLTGISTSLMFDNCSSLRSITFNNLPVGTTEETLRSKCNIPSTVTEIIMNYRSE